MFFSVDHVLYVKLDVLDRQEQCVMTTTAVSDSGAERSNVPSLPALIYWPWWALTSILSSVDNKLASYLWRSYSEIKRLMWKWQFAHHHVIIDHVLISEYIRVCLQFLPSSAIITVSIRTNLTNLFKNWHSVWNLWIGNVSELNRVPKPTSSWATHMHFFVKIA